MERAVTNEAGNPVAQLRFRRAVSADDPLSLFSAVLTKARTIWMQRTYPFARFGRDVSIHYSCDIRRSAASRIRIGNSVYIASGTWLNIPEPAIDAPPAIILENGCKIGRRCMISAKNRVCLEEDVLFGPSVLITDHSHEFSDPDMPIHAQGLTDGGTVLIGRNSWLGHGAAVICTSGDLSVGRNSIIGANSVVTRSVPPFSVVIGNPAKVVRRYDPDSGEWIKVGSPGDAAGEGLGR
jgi:acetyltransferase-like isoleucine patch superfamily enzyme